MASKIFCVTFDCHDPARVAEFWAAALSYDIDAGWIDYGEVFTSDPKGVGPPLLFMAVPEAKEVKNRVHVDLRPETSMEEEVARLETAGATTVSILQDPEGYEEPWTWTVMRDPEGNEFCVGEQLSDRA